MSYLNEQVVVRFPPSPTGEWHFGNARTFVFNYLFAKKNNGKIVMRFEDTDTARNKPGAAEAQLQILKDLGMDFDEGPYYQSQRTEIYKKELHRLIAEGTAYEAEENQAGTGKIIRLKNPGKKIKWNDLIKGEIEIDTLSFKDDGGNADFVIARSADNPLYHFTVVVDDWLMGITHVIRGEDHVTSTPRQILIFEALGAPVPLFGHQPTILGENKKKLGKRNGAIPVREYLEMGYLPEALMNAIALLGWNPGNDSLGEIFRREELIQNFSLEKVQKQAAIFTGDKLDHINKEHIKFLSDEEFISWCMKYFSEEEKILIENNFEKNKKIFLKVYRDRISKFTEVAAGYRAHEINMFFPFLYNQEFEKFDKNKILFKEQTESEMKDKLAMVLEKIKDIPEGEWTVENLKNILWDWSATVSRGTVLHPLRMLLSLREKSPDPFTIMEIVGKEESLRRIGSLIKL
jgi:glutamyl-tRNA synthetase